jgi:hypothetical protein
VTRHLERAGGRAAPNRKAPKVAGMGDDSEEDRQRGSNKRTKRTRGRSKGTMGDRSQGLRQQGKAGDSEAAESKTLTGKERGIRAWLQGRPNAQGPGEREKKQEPRGEGADLEAKKEISQGQRNGGRGGEEMHLQGSEPQVSLINKGIVPVARGRITTEEGSLSENDNLHWAASLVLS